MAACYLAAVGFAGFRRITVMISGRVTLTIRVLDNMMAFAAIVT